jgi:Heparinase II/III-like protein/Heparinase II/III N-terminus
VQCELSTDYHHVVLKNYLHVRRLASINGIRVPIAMDLAVLRALEFSLHVHKPDGIVPSLSDGDTGSFLDLLGYGADLYDRDDLRYVATRGIEGTAPVDRVAHFAASGYTIVRSDWGHDPASFRDAQYLVLDSGPLGEGNHGHFDCLSFELAAFGRSLIVDPGRYTYSETGPDNWRVHFRGTAAHNTVSVDAKQQTRYEWQGKTSRHKVTGPEPDSAMCERLHGAHLDLLHASVASHEYDAVHQRCIVFVDRSYWIVSDWLRAPSMHCYVLNFQLGAHAQGATRIGTSDGLYARSPGLSLLQPEREDVVHELHDAWVSARYGDKQPAPAIRSAVVACDADFDTVLVPWVSTEPAVGVSLIEVRNAPGGALRIELIACGEPVVDHWFHTRDAHAARHCIDGFELVGRWAFWRTDAEGRVIRATSHEGAALTDLRGLIARAVALDTEDAS